MSATASPPADDHGELNLVLGCTAEHINHAADALATLNDATGSTSADIDQLEDRLNRLFGDNALLVAPLCANAVAPPPDHQHRSAASSVEAAEPNASPDFDQAVAYARNELAKSGRSPEDIAIESLLDRGELAAIRSRHLSPAVSARLDRYDVFAAIAIGMVAGVVDHLAAATPRTSPITERLRRLASTPADNWLSDRAKVPYDAIWNSGVDGMTPLSHRTQTYGHDPLVGLIIGTLDIMEGTLTGVSPTGKIQGATRSGFDTTSAPEALTLQVMHLLSDIPTATGLPLPGWLGLASVSCAIGDKSIAEITQTMYRRGYNTWHTVALQTPVATVELLARVYWNLREHLDVDFAPLRDDQRLSDLPRFRALTLVALATAGAMDLAGFAASSGNPLTLNYSLWLDVASRSAKQAAAATQSPARLLNNHLDRLADC